MAQAVELDPALQSGSDEASETKQHRLKIAGWTLVGAGLGAVVATVTVTGVKYRKADPEDRAVILGQYLATGAVISIGLAGTGGILLGRRRRLSQRHDDPLTISVGMTGVTFSGQF